MLDRFAYQGADGNIHQSLNASDATVGDNKKKNVRLGKPGNWQMGLEKDSSLMDSPVKVSVSMVTFNSSFELLNKTLDSLDHAVSYAQQQGLPLLLELLLVDNSTDRGYRIRIQSLIDNHPRLNSDNTRLWHPGDNIGYGAAHNEALQFTDSDYHLILNPDVEMAEDALCRAYHYLQQESDVVMVSPRAADSNGQVQYLCKRYPSVLALTLRGFAPGFVREWFRGYLSSYEIRDHCSDSGVADVPLVSGCCMFARTQALRSVAGFSGDFFMYFEDFDLSLRLHEQGRLVYLPSMQIVHHGGYSARKGLRHISMFVSSGWKFFRTHGWCWI
jgi:GT2 family glycosyltransferase